mmetsp:Transcript_66937/g.173239  ORF Transcript_66937/g.173239 Transcript_66937/m.173239 type:complete len:215 (+) Transcript_66937:1-645(+)
MSATWILPCADEPARRTKTHSLPLRVRVGGGLKRGAGAIEACPAEEHSSEGRRGARGRSEKRKDASPRKHGTDVLRVTQAQVEWEATGPRHRSAELRAIVDTVGTDGLVDAEVQGLTGDQQPEPQDPAGGRRRAQGVRHGPAALRSSETASREEAVLEPSKHGAQLDRLQTQDELLHNRDRVLPQKAQGHGPRSQLEVFRVVPNVGVQAVRRRH